jgi:hypothetical protein
VVGHLAERGLLETHRVGAGRGWLRAAARPDREQRQREREAAVYTLALCTVSTVSTVVV